uniref:Glyco_tran_10_N domain-containing protein n=1 Tax=Ascaris lumbricoides TaxID=6252 RepID=A0A0M3I9E0_ASCLU
MVSLSCFFLIRWFEYSFSEDLPLSDKSIALEPASSTSPSSLSNAKLIVQWTNVFGKRMAEANMEDCSLSPENSCYISTDRSRLNEAAAVVFHIWNEDLKIKDLPAHEDRHLDQLYVFMTMEAPPNHNRALIASLPGAKLAVKVSYEVARKYPHRLAVGFFKEYIASFGHFHLCFKMELQTRCLPEVALFYAFFDESSRLIADMQRKMTDKYIIVYS